MRGILAKPASLSSAFLAVILCGLAQVASADVLLDRFPAICGDASQSFEERVQNLTASGWSLRNSGMWESYEPMLTEAFVSTSIVAGASAARWAETRAMAVQLSGIVAMTPADREDAGLGALKAVVMVSASNPVAVLAVLDEGMIAEGRIHCYYAGPLPTEIASFVTQMESLGFTEMNDPFVRQYSVENTKNENGKTQVSAQLVSILTEDSAQYLGGPPRSAAAISIYTQPSSR